MIRQFMSAAQQFSKVIVALAALYAVACHAQTPADGAAETNGIESISTSKSEGGKLVVSIVLKQQVTAKPEIFSIGTPPRIALTFPNTTNELGSKAKEINEGALRNAIIVQAPDPVQKFRTRLILNLSQAMTYDAPVIDGKTLLLTLKPREVSADKTASAFAEARPSAQKHSLRDVDFHRGNNGEGRVQVDLSDANVGIDIKQEGAKLFVDFANTELPKNLQRKLDVVDFATPVQLIDARAVGDKTELVIEPQGAWEYSAYQADTKFIIEVKKVVADVKRQAKTGPKQYDGDKLTLNFQNITVREALNVIADFTNLNIVISDTVSGNLTLRLKDVPWDQALDIILQSKGLDMRKNGNVVQVAPREELAAKEKGALSAVQEIAELEPMRTESFQLSYAKAADISRLITDPNQRMLSKRGSAVQDLRTNTLFVQDIPGRLEDVRSLIKQIDIPVRQVMIEARFVEAKDTFTRNLGGRLTFKGAASNSVIGNPANPSPYTSGIATGNVNLPGYTSGTGGISLALTDAAGTNTLNLELLASQTDGVTKNIASPRVVTADKSPATIESGVEIPYLQASSSGATNVAFKKAVLSLNVTPIITPDDHINMTVAVNQDTVGAIYSGVPSVDTKKVTTQVLVDNGGTVVIGGVYTQNDSDSTTKVPWLGDIPILGWFFKNKAISHDKKELLVFITPKIMKENLGLK